MAGFGFFGLGVAEVVEAEMPWEEPEAPMAALERGPERGVGGFGGKGLWVVGGEAWGMGEDVYVRLT